MGAPRQSQKAMAKAIASGDQRLMLKAGLEADIARLERLRAAHIDDQHAVRRQLRDAERDIEFCMRRITEIGRHPERRAGIAQIFLNDVDEAIADVEFAAAHGLRGGILLPAVPPDARGRRPGRAGSGGRGRMRRQREVGLRRRTSGTHFFPLPPSCIVM